MSRFDAVLSLIAVVCIVFGGSLIFRGAASGDSADFHVGWIVSLLSLAMLCLRVKD